MFKKRPETAEPTVRIFFEGAPIDASSTSSVAAALLCAGIGPLRQAVVTGEPRAPHCMIGTCYECMVEIDGEPARQACLTSVRDGMRIERQAPAPKVEI